MVPAYPYGTALLPGRGPTPQRRVTPYGAGVAETEWRSRLRVLVLASTGDPVLLARDGSLPARLTDGDRAGRRTAGSPGRPGWQHVRRERSVRAGAAGAAAGLRRADGRRRDAGHRRGGAGRLAARGDRCRLRGRQCRRAVDDPHAEGVTGPATTGRATPRAANRDRAAGRTAGPDAGRCTPPRPRRPGPSRGAASGHGGAAIRPAPAEPRRARRS